MLSGTLVQIKSKHTRVRTKEIEGRVLYIPEVGHEFILFAQPLEIKVGFRLIQTSRVSACRYDETKRVFSFTTQNSEYEFQVNDVYDPMSFVRTDIEVGPAH